MGQMVKESNPFLTGGLTSICSDKDIEAFLQEPNVVGEGKDRELYPLEVCFFFFFWIIHSIDSKGDELS